LRTFHSRIERCPIITHAVNDGNRRPRELLRSRRGSTGADGRQDCAWADTPYMSNMDSVRNNTALSRYELDLGSNLGGGTAVLNYRPVGGVLHLGHTETPRHARGQGVAARLVQGALDDIRTQGLKVTPRCSFVHSFIDQHPAYHDLLA
jgi:predicted GNAT family acetyltransferase